MSKRTWKSIKKSACWSSVLIQLTFWKMGPQNVLRKGTDIQFYNSGQHKHVHFTLVKPRLQRVQKVFILKIQLIILWGISQKEKNQKWFKQNWTPLVLQVASVISDEMNIGQHGISLSILSFSFLHDGKELSLIIQMKTIDSLKFLILMWHI